MLPRKLRLVLTPAQKFTGSKSRYPSCLVISAPNSLSHSRLTVIISKSVLPLSSSRHRLKRQLHGLFVRSASSLPPLDILFIVRSADSPTVLSDFTAFLSSLHTKY